MMKTGKINSADSGGKKPALLRRLRTAFRGLKIMVFPVALFTAVSLFAGGEKQLYKFQFAPDNAPAFLDFVKVSKKQAYTPAAGYGWKNPAVLVEKLNKDPGGDILARSYVANVFGRDMEFLLDVPNGKYEVVFWMGDAGSYAYPSRSFTVFAGGQTAYHEEIDTATYYNKYFCRTYGVDWTMKDTSLWDKYVAPEFPRRTFITEVKNGQLSLRWYAIGINHRTDAYCADCRVHGLMVYPLELKAAAGRELQQCDKSRRRGFNSFWREVRNETASARPLVMTEEDKKAGYVLFTRHYMNYVYPSTIPAEDERLQTLKVFAAQGEYEPITFSVRPVVDLRDVKISVSDFKNKNGAVINNSAITVEWIVHNVWPAHGKYVVMPEYSMKKNLVDLTAGTAKQCWLTLKVPDDAQGGLYHGTVTFAPRNSLARQI
ncbi:MAG: DUF6067 family protein, partial [Victivallales bacterium]|nr:DUF6067 family protein [Victivallales bacterium]